VPSRPPLFRPAAHNHIIPGRIPGAVVRVRVGGTDSDRTDVEGAGASFQAKMEVGELTALVFDASGRPARDEDAVLNLPAAKYPLDRLFRQFRCLRPRRRHVPSTEILAVKELDPVSFFPLLALRLLLVLSRRGGDAQYQQDNLPQDKGLHAALREKGTHGRATRKIGA